MPLPNSRFMYLITANICPDPFPRFRNVRNANTHAHLSNSVVNGKDKTMTVLLVATTAAISVHPVPIYQLKLFEHFKFENFTFCVFTNNFFLRAKNIERFQVFRF